MKTVAGAGGVPIAIEQSGRGPNLVLVHGTTGDRSRWAALKPLLEPHFTVTVVDRRGRGDSGDGADYDIALEYEDVVAVTDMLDAPVFLFGHSYGGICALEAAMRTDRLAGLILYEPPISRAGSLPASLIERMDALLAAGDREAVVSVFLGEVLGMPPEQLEAFRQTSLWEGRVAAAHTLPRELRAVNGYRFDPARAASLDLPVLILLGGDSADYFRAATESLQNGLPDARTVVMPGQQHIAMDTAPKLVADAVLEFCRGRG